MNEDIVQRLRANDADVCWGCGEWGCKAECTCECHEAKQLLIEAAEEIERLRTLITAWADNRDERDGFPWGLEPREAKERDDARWARSKEIESALLEAVGR